MKELKAENMVALNGGNWAFACGVGIALSASLIGLLIFGPSTGAICYCAISGDC